MAERSTVVGFSIIEIRLKTYDHGPWFDSKCSDLLSQL